MAARSWAAPLWYPTTTATAPAPKLLLAPSPAAIITAVRCPVLRVTDAAVVAVKAEGWGGRKASVPCCSSIRRKARGRRLGRGVKAKRSLEPLHLVEEAMLLQLLVLLLLLLL